MSHKCSRRRNNARRRQDAITARHPRHIENKYRRRLLQHIRAIGRLVSEETAKILARHGEELNERADSEDAIVRDIIRMIAGVRLSAERVWTDKAIKDYTTEIAGQLDLFEKRQLTQQWSAVMGVDPILGDRATAGIIRQFSLENLRLIKDMPDQFLTQIQDELVDATRTGQRAEVFQDKVQERLGVGESRAKLIARDQIASINGALTETRQIELGVTEYVWSTSDDERVVGTPGGTYPEATSPEMHGNHYERDGEVFSWSNPPLDGHPGRAINCRCQALPKVDDLL